MITSGRMTRARVAAPENRPEAEKADEDGQAEDAVDDRRHAGQVADVRLQESGQAAVRSIFRKVDRNPDADRKRDHGDDDASWIEPMSAGRIPVWVGRRDAMR
jgi:hypothetical protein